MANKQKHSSRLVGYLLVICLVVVPLSADIVIQGQNCGSQQTPLVVRMTQKDEDTIVSHAGQYYELSKDCIVTIIGKPYYQFELDLRRINIDSRTYYADYCKGLCCNDYLKMYNSYRVDNARLFPVIGWKGLCGTELPKVKVYTTSHNFVTIQFRTDEYYEPMGGFVIGIRQYLRRNDGNINPEGGYIGGWNDGTYSEWQMDWTEQEQIPGDQNLGGGGNDYDKEKNGIQCYECYGCRIDYFDPKSSTDRSTIRNNCFVCSKEYQDGIARANRRCYSRLQYRSLLLTLTDTSTGSGTVKDFRGCRKFMNVRGIFINYCLCDAGNLCNTAMKVPLNLTLVIVSLFMSWLWGLF